MPKTTCGCIACAEVWVEDREVDRETCPECGSGEFYTASHDGPQGLEDQVGGLFVAGDEPVRRATDVVVEPLEEGYELLVDCPDCEQRISWRIDALDEEAEVICPGCESVFETELSAGETLREEIREGGQDSLMERINSILPWN